MTTRVFGSTAANVVCGSAEVFASACEWLFRSLSSCSRSFTRLCSFVAKLPLYALISIDFDAVDECGPGALYSILDVDMLQNDLPEALSPE